MRCQENLFLASVGACPNDGHPLLMQCGSGPALPCGSTTTTSASADSRVSTGKREIDKSNFRIGTTSVHFVLYFLLNTLLRKAVIDSTKLSCGACGCNVAMARRKVKYFPNFVLPVGQDLHKTF